jgi:hypothetical protein
MCADATAMIPAIHPGDTLWIEPDSKPRKLDFVLLHDLDGKPTAIVQLLHETRWCRTVRTLNPREKFKVGKLVKMHRVDSIVYYTPKDGPLEAIAAD